MHPILEAKKSALISTKAIRTRETGAPTFRGFPTNEGILPEIENLSELDL